MPRTRLDGTGKIEITFSDGEPTTFSMRWAEELTDDTDVMINRRFEHYDFSDLPMDAAKSLANLLGYMTMHRDIEHPLT
jgi:hypothetical protein